MTALDNSEGEDNGEGPDPDAIKDLLEDAPVLLGNVNFRLNAWRQKRFSEFLTEVGKRTLREGIPADKHLFPDKFHTKIKTEHDHSSTNSKLISTPASKNTSPKDHTGGSSPFVDTTAPLTTVELEGNGNGDIAQGLTCSPPKGPEQRDPPSNLTPRPARADYPCPCLKMFAPPNNRPPTRLKFFVQNWKQITQELGLYKQFRGTKSPFAGAPGNGA